MGDVDENLLNSDVHLHLDLHRTTVGFKDAVNEGKHLVQIVYLGLECQSLRLVLCSIALRPHVCEAEHGDVVELLCFRHELGNTVRDRIYQCLRSRFPAIVECVDKPVVAEQLQGIVGGLCDTVRIDEQRIAGIELELMVLETDVAHDGQRR